MARRFIVEKEDIKYISKEDNIIEINGKEVKHIQVLRYNVDDQIILNEYVCKILKIRNNSIELKIVCTAKKYGEPSLKLTLYMAMLKGDKMDLVIQKSVELGVKYIVPFISNNTIVKLDEKGKQKRKDKLQIIANEACKQCGRTDLVEIKNIVKFNEMVNLTKEHELTLFAYENQNKEENLHSALEIAKNKKYGKISVIIGPEGGFTEVEAKNLKSLNYVKCVSLGTRILRAETAAIGVISVIIYELDND